MKSTLKNSSNITHGTAPKTAQSSQLKAILSTSRGQASAYLSKQRPYKAPRIKAI
jgi:hypothetical protein